VCEVLSSVPISDYGIGVTANGRETASLAVVVGANCKRIRSAAGVTQNTLALRARRAGLRWNTGKVGQFERGQYSPTFGTVLAVSYALSIATKTNVTPADLVVSDGFVAVTEEFDPTGAALHDVLSGKRRWDEVVIVADDTGYTSRLAADPEFAKKIADGLAKRPGDRRYADIPTDDYLAIEERSGLDEERLAKRLGIDRHQLAIESYLLWGCAFSDERDRLAGPDANAQKRGRISRTLQAELEKELADGHD
jgi:transcriptional regulator with XRE-family HTH domain